MKIMLDTNILISAMLFPNKEINATMAALFSDNEIYLSSYVVDELKYVVRRKFPSKINTVDKLLLKMNYILSYTPDIIDESMFNIRDMKDYPVLYSAILEEVDILITGDKDFDDIDIDKPEIMSLAEYKNRYL